MKLLKIVLILVGIHFITDVNAMDSKIILEDDLKTRKYTTKSVDFTL